MIRHNNGVNLLVNPFDYRDHNLSRSGASNSIIIFLMSSTTTTVIQSIEMIMLKFPCLFQFLEVGGSHLSKIVSNNFAHCVKEKFNNI